MTAMQWGNVPDPCRPLSDLFRASDAQFGQRWIQQRQRRSEILAAARALMTETACEQVRLQEVAATCGISIQTIYNIIGNREELMSASGEEWVAAIAAVAGQTAEAQDLNASFVMLAMFWDAGLTQPGYVHSAARSTLADYGSLRARFSRAGTQVLLADLQRAGLRGGVRAGVDITSLARQLALLANVTICTWSAERYDLATFRRELINGPGLMLAGALQGEELRRLERGMAQLDS